MSFALMKISLSTGESPVDVKSLGLFFTFFFNKNSFLPVSGPLVGSLAEEAAGSKSIAGP